MSDVAVAREPAPATVRRYGLTLDEWRAILERQGGVCGVCKKVPPSATLCVDHEHVRGWGKMSPENRKRHIRGLACFRCNVAMRRGTTVEWLVAATKYLEAYERRRA